MANKGELAQCLQSASKLESRILDDEWVKDEMIAKL